MVLSKLEADRLVQAITQEKVDRATTTQVSQGVGDGSANQRDVEESARPQDRKLNEIV